jgi:hypothetical protein
VLHWFVALMMKLAQAWHVDLLSLSLGIMLMNNDARSAAADGAAALR